MIYNILINQVKSAEYGLTLESATVLYVFLLLPTWGKSQEIDGNIYYYLSIGKIKDEVPILSIGESRMRQIVKQLKDSGLLDWKLYNNRSFYRLTDKSISFLKDGHNKGVTNIPIKPTKPTITKTNNQYDELFEKFWEAYPKQRRQGKMPAKRKLSTILSKSNDADNLMQSMINSLQSQVKIFAQGGSDWKFFKMPLTWLNQECWTDEVDTSAILDIKDFEQWTKVQFLEYCKVNYKGNWAMLPNNARLKFQTL